VLYGDPAPLPNGTHSAKFSAHVCCGQTAGWIKIPLGREAGLAPGHIVLDADPAPLPQRGTAPQFSADVYCGQTVAHISATAEHLFVMNLHVICFILCRSSSSDYCPPQFLLREHFHCTACVPQVRCFAKCGHL